MKWSEELTLAARNELRRAVSAEGVLWTVREAWPAAEGYWNLTVRALLQSIAISIGASLIVLTLYHRLPSEAS